MNITRYDDVLEFSALGIAAGGTGAVLGLLWNMGFDSGDVFSLAGAAIGAAVTVTGALWVAARRERTAHHRETSILVEYCRPMLEKADEVVATYPHGTSWKPEYQRGLQQLSGLGLELPALLDEALHRAQTLDFRERVKVRKAADKLQDFYTFYGDWFGERELPESDERTWPITLDYLREGLAELLEALKRN